MDAPRHAVTTGVRGQGRQADLALSSHRSRSNCRWARRRSRRAERYLYNLSGVPGADFDFRFQPILFLFSPIWKACATVWSRLSHPVRWVGPAGGENGSARENRVSGFAVSIMKAGDALVRPTGPHKTVPRRSRARSRENQAAAFGLSTDGPYQIVSSHF